MDDLAKVVEGDDRFRLRQVAVSAGIHASVLLVVLGFFHRAPKVAPYKLPGTAHGTQLLTYYAAGSPEHAVSELASKSLDKPKVATSLHAPAAKPMPEKTAEPSTEKGIGNSAVAGLGDGDINIALLKYFPRPKPDLSALPPGSQGDVVLDAIIDEHGKISQLKLLKGLGESVDNQVIAAVRQWTYNPATKNGTPVPSEQELHFHYERG